MFQTGLQGLTGNIEFNEGKRSNFKLDLLKLKKEEIKKVGQWTPAGGINITDPSAFYDTHAPNITLIVMTREVGINDAWYLPLIFYAPQKQIVYRLSYKSVWFEISFLYV